LLDEIKPRFLLLAAMKATTCNACGFNFNARTGKSTAPVVIAAYAAPLVLAVVLVSVFLLLR
jgi:hypothetical protein